MPGRRADVRLRSGISMRLVVAVFIRYAAVAVQFLVTLFAARQLHPADLGTYMMIYGAVTSTYVAAGAGAPDGIVRLAPALAAKGDALGARRIVADAFGGSLSSSGALALVVGAGAGLATSSVAMGLLGALWWLGYALCYISAQSLVALGRATLGTFFYYGSVNWATFVTVGGYSLLAPRSGLVGMTGATVAGAGVAAVASCTLVLGMLHTRPSWRWRHMAEAVRIGVPLALIRASQSVLIWSPVWVTGAVLGAGSAASVSLGSRIVMAVGSAIAAVRFSVRPALVGMAAHNDWTGIEQLGRRIAVAAGLVCLVAAAGDAIIGPFLLPRIFGASYDSLWWIVLLLMLGSFAESIAGPTDEALKMSDGSIFVLVSQVLAILLAGAVEVAAGHIFGVAGVIAAFATAFTLLFMAIVGEVRARRGVWPALLPPLVLPRFPFATASPDR